MTRKPLVIIGGVVAKQAILLYVFLYWNKTKEKYPETFAPN